MLNINFIIKDSEMIKKKIKKNYLVLYLEILFNN